MKKLIALAFIAAAASGTVDIQSNQGFEADDNIADDLIAANLAKLATEDAAPVKPTKTVKVRLLMDSPLGKVNDVVALSAADAKAAEAGGHADSAKEAVAYAMTLPQNQPKG